MQNELNAYWRSKDHFRHTPGCPQSQDWDKYYTLNLPERIQEVQNRLRACGRMDMAWLVMLYEQKLVPVETVRKLYDVLQQTQKEKGWGGEEWIKARLPDHDEDTAAAVNYGRTLQEPMSRMMIRESLLYVFDEIMEARTTLLKLAAENLDTMMAGHSHWSHAQPITYAAYLLGVHDQLERGTDQLVQAYRHINRNTGGCGACSGTGWPVNRERITELLGFEQTVELTYDCESSMDAYLTSLFAAGNIAVTLSRTAMDFNVWVTEEWNLFYVDMSWRGVSSFMPQKANAGNQFERTRILCNEMLGKMMTTLFSFKNEPIQDILPVYGTDRYVIEGLALVESAIGLFRCLLPAVKPNRERMLQLLRDGYSGAPDLAIKLIREKKYGGRCAHRICATMVRIARERSIRPCDCKGGLLDEAARISCDPEPHMSDAEVNHAMGIEHFFETHNLPGDPHPEQMARLVEKRVKALNEERRTQEIRKSKLTVAYDTLNQALVAIVKSSE